MRGFMSLKISIAAAAAAALLAGASNASATAIMNGSFEIGPSAPNGYYLELGAGSTALPGWPVGGNSTD